MKKFALYSSSLPPYVSGQSIIIERLLSELDTSNFVLFTKKHKKNIKSKYNTYYFLKDKYIMFILKYVKIKKINILLANFFIRINAYFMKRYLFLEKVEIVICCTSDLLNPISLYKSSKELDIPFVLYVFDDFIFQWPFEYRKYAEVFEEKYISNADKFIFTNEFAFLEYSKRFKVNNYIYVRNLLPKNYEFRNTFDNEPKDEKILFAGSIYHLNIDVIIDFAKAIDNAFDRRFNLDIYLSNYDYKILDKFRLFYNTKIKKPLDYDSVLQLYANYKYLLIPFTNNSLYNKIVNTSAPGKFGEYLASGKIIIAIVPNDSYVAWYLKKYECGILLDANNILKSVELLNEIINDKDYLIYLMNNARKRAYIDFSFRDNSIEFYNMIDFK